MKENGWCCVGETLQAELWQRPARFCQGSHLQSIVAVPIYPLPG